MASNSISFGGTNFGVQVGINHGSIYPIERPETPPEPLSTCPFRRDPDFVDPGTLLEDIYQKGCAPAARIALVGLGGVGKSQLAIECCYRIQERSPETWVFWIHAANAGRFEKSCWDIANRVKIPKRNDPAAKVFQLIHNWLSDKRHGKWVIILDNVDDSRFLHETPAVSNKQEGGGPSMGGSLLECFPVSGSGSIIITSRTRDAVDSIVEPKDMISIGPMNESDAAQLFEKKLGETPTQDADRLLQELDFMPLAIVQAASHIRHRAPRLSVSQYLRKFQQNDQERIRLLKHEKGQLRRDREAKNSILVTWQISFDHIQRNNSAAADVLSLMCLFDRQGIPENLLRRQKQEIDNNYNSEPENDHGDSNIPQKLPNPSKESELIPLSIAASVLESDSLSVYSADNEFEESLSTLRDYHLITVDVDGATLEMHRLVQLAMREWLEAHGQLEQWKQCFIDILVLNFPVQQWEKWDACRLLLPHVLSAVMQPPTEERTLGRWTQLVKATASFALDKGYYAQSEELATLVFNTRTNIFGSHDERTIRSLTLVGRATWNRGKWKDAELVHHQVMEAYTQMFGLDHRHTLVSMSALASIYSQQCRWNEAEELSVQVMEISKRILGPEHPDTLDSMLDLATNYIFQGRLYDAEGLAVRVFKGEKGIFGLNHPKTLHSMSYLASTYSQQKRWNKAEELHIQVMEISKRILGPEHPDTLDSMRDLAKDYMHQSRIDQAEELAVQALEGKKRILGPKHPDTLHSMRNLADIYRSQGRWNEAEELAVRVIKAHMRTLGTEHPDTLISMSDLAATHCLARRWNKAEKLQLQVLEIRQRILGPEHHDTLVSMGKLASSYGGQGRWNEAEELDLQVLEVQKRILGPEHPDTLSSMYAYAFTLKALNQHNSAICLMSDYVRLYIRTFGPENPDTISANRILDGWREIKDPSCTEDTGSPPKASSKAPSDDKHQKSESTVSKEDSQPSQRRKRAMFSRIFRRSSNT